MYSELTRDIDLEFNMIENPDSNLHLVYTPTVQNILSKQEPLFFFWVFNYKQDIANKFIEVDYNDMARREFNESIRKTVEEINKNERDNWQMVRPLPSNCNQCAILNCPVRETFNKPVVEHNQFETI